MFQPPFLQVFWVHLLACLTIFSRSPHLLVENLLSLPPPPFSPKTPVIARKIIKIVIEWAVSTEKIVMLCSRNRIRILFAIDVFLSRTFSMVCLIFSTCVWRSFRFWDSISSLACFLVSYRLIYLCIATFVHRNKWDYILLLVTLVYLWMRLSISVSLEVLFESSPCMLSKALSIPRNSRMSRLAFCDTSRVLTRTSSSKDGGSFSGIPSICEYVGRSLLSLLATLIDLSSEGGV